MIEIREPKYKVGDKVYCKQYKSSAIITGISDYSFNNDKYFHYVKWEHDDYLDEIHEDLLEPYIEKPKSVLDLQNGDTYYAIDYGNMNVFSLVFNNDEYDLNCMALGNCFLTKEEAEYELERVKIENEMLRLGGRREFKKGEDNYYIFCDFSSQYDVRIYKEKDGSYGKGMIYFDSIKDCRNAIDSIGEDRIKKYYFGVES